MANKTTLALTDETYRQIITLINNGFYDTSGRPHRPNERVATVLTLEANLGMRVSDIMQMTLEKIVRDGDRYRLDVIEQKTRKRRTFTVPDPVYMYIQNYALRHNIKENQPLFKITERQVQKHLKYTADVLGLKDVSTHSFRKYFATSIYKNNQHDIRLVQQLLQHAHVTTTQAYVGVGSEEMEKALNMHVKLID